MNPNSNPKRSTISWVLLCVASFLITASAFGQVSVTSPQGLITINDVSKATPFPSTNFIATGTTTGLVEKVTVRLNGVSHGYPDDIDMLLRAPNGMQQMIWSDAGGQFDLFGVNVTLDSTASTALPDEAQIVSGTYKPADYDGGDGDSILLSGLPSGGTFVTDLNGAFSSGSGLLGAPPTAIEGSAWQLFVADDNVVDSGSIGSWTLNVYMSPVLALGASSLTMGEDTSSTINVMVNDTDSALSGLTLSASSDNTTVIPNGGLTFGGNTGGTNRTLTITPAANQFSATPVTITVKAKDEQGKEFAGVNVQTITVTVTNVNDAPTLVLVTTSATIGQGGITAPINVAVQDIDDPATGSVLTAISSNPTVIPATNVLFTRVASGSVAGTNRNVQIAANATSGSSTITLVATDAHGASNVANIFVTVTNIPPIVAANPSAIVVPGTVSGGPATLYPSFITIPTIANVSQAGKVTVSLNDIEHANPSDLAVLLVAPSGQKVVLMRDVGGTSDSQPAGIGDTNDVRLTFDSSATTTLSTIAGLTTSTNLPSDAAPGANFPSPAPAGPYSTDMNSLVGAQVAGNWQLYVWDVGFPNSYPSSEIGGGWVLTIQAAPVITGLTDITTLEDTAKTVSFQVGDREGAVTNVVAAVVNDADTNRVTVTSTLSGTTATLTVTPKLNANTGTPSVPIAIAVTAKDNSGGFTTTQIINLNITEVNDAPVQSVIPKQITRAGQSLGPITFQISDIETLDPNSLQVTATSNNPKLLPPGAIILGGSGGTRTITLFPSGAAGGLADVSVTVTDNGAGSPTGTPVSSTQTFNLTVNEAASPLYENTTGIQVIDNALAVPYPSTINVSGLVGTVAEVQVTLYGLTEPVPSDVAVLLVGPGPNPIGVNLMSGAGDAVSITNVTLRFHPTGGTPYPHLPSGAALVSGDYLASALPPVPGFPAPPPSTATPPQGATDLSALTGINPNGDWKLYVLDTNPSSRGGAISSWQLSIRTHPVLPVIPTQTTIEDTSFRLTITAGDNQPGVPLTAVASVLPVSPTTSVIIASIKDPSGNNIIGTPTTINGGSQSFTITPVLDAFGTNSVNITVTDNNGVSDTKTFSIVVTPVNDAPRFVGLTDKVSTGTATPSAPIPFTVYDPEGTAVTVTASSSDQNIVADSGISISPATAGSTPTNSPPARTVIVTPVGVVNGSATITLVATDADGQKSTTSFVVTVSPSVAFLNTNPIIINDNAPATPYPSVINVAGVNGTVSGATVVLVGFSHQFPDDADVLLVAPDGRTVMLMSDAGGPTPVNNLRLTFADSATLGAIPDESALTSGTYQPANYLDPNEINEMPFPAPPAPVTGYPTTLSSLAGVNPNGQWQLFVRDDQFPQGGSISGGWILLLQTAPVITQLPTAAGFEDTPLALRFTVSDQDSPASELTISAKIEEVGTIDANKNLGFNNTGPTAIYPNTIASPSGTPITFPFSSPYLTLVTNGANFPDVNYTLTLLSATNAPSSGTGTNRVTITATDKQGTSSKTTFLVILQTVNDAPLITGALVGSGGTTNRVATTEDTPITIQWQVVDVDTSLGASSNIVVQSSNRNLLPNTSTNIVISGPNNINAGVPFTVSATLNFAPDQNGTTILTFIATDALGASSTNQVQVDVAPANDLPTIVLPTFGVGTELDISVGTSITIPVTINDVETPATDVTVSVAAASDPTSQAILPSSNLVLGGRGTDRTLTITPVGTVINPVTSSITITANDNTGGVSTKTFTVVVKPPSGQVFANNGTILIPGTGTAGPASPYPSTLSVGGLIGPISKVNVSIDGLTHTAPDDIDMLLVSPSGKKTLLMSDAGGHIPVNGIQLVFDSNGSLLPDESALSSGTYRPADYEPGGDIFPTIVGSPVPPAAPYSSSLSDFVGSNPNGTWQLFINDDAAGDSGQINNGWSLRITTAPDITVDQNALLGMTEDVSRTVNFSINDQSNPPEKVNISYSLSDSTTARVALTNRLGSSGNFAQLSVTVVSSTNGFGTNNLTITARSSDGTTTVTLPVSIGPINDAPSVSRLVDQTTQADAPITVPIAITDVDTPLSNVRISVSSGNPNVIETALLSGRFTNIVGVVPNASSAASFPQGALDTWTNFIVLTPKAAATGVNIPITLTIDELNSSGNPVPGQTTIATFNVTVTPVNHAPFIAGANGTNALPGVAAVEAGKSTNIVFSALDPDNNNVTLTASSDNQALVRDADIVITDNRTGQIVTGVSVAPGTNFTARVNTQPGVTGDATITLRAIDPSNARGTGVFVVRLTATREQVFANRQQITIRDFPNPADPYPSQIVVSGFAGAVSKVTVTLNGFWHTYPEDVDIVLVSPSGRISYVMSDAGGGNPVPPSAPITMKFDDSDPNNPFVPDSTQLTARTYKVANYDPTTPTSDPFAASGGPVVTALTPAALNTFAGDNPNGVWSLYVLDDTASDSGAITNGWSIGITTLPLLSGLADATSPEDRPIVQNFTISEEAFANVGNYTFAVSSTNTALVPSSTANIVVTGTGTNRTVTIIPVLNANTNNAGGPSKITLTEQTTGVSASFNVSFTPVNDSPFITQVPDQTVPGGLFVTVPNFIYSDVETAKKDLVVNISSSDPSILPASNIVISGTDLRIFAGTQPGTVTITISVTDTTDGFSPPTTSSMSFKVTVTAALNTVVSNNNPTTINDNSRANPYPSTLSVSGVNGTVANVTVTLLGLTHPFPDDIDMLLVGPNGQGVVLMSDAGGGGSPQTSLNNASVIISDTAGQAIPDNGPIVPFSAYKPTNYEISNNEFVAPAPTGPYPTTIAAAFGGINPNGTWSLYMQDDASPDAGSLAGWVLNIALNEVGPALTGLVDTTTNENSFVQIPFTVTSSDLANVSFTTAASNSNLVSVIKIGGSGTSRTLFITLVPNAFGTSQITVTATDITGTRTRQFLLTVNHVEQAPVLGPISDIRISGSTNIVLNVSDIDTPLTSLTFFASTAGVGIIQDVHFNVNGSIVTATITPVPNAVGSDRVTISVSDGTTTVNQSFNVTTVVAGPPVLGPIADVTTTANTSAIVTLNVTDPDTALSDLVFFATSSGSTLVKDVRFNLSSSNTVLMTIVPTAGQKGTERLTISASDGTATANQSFNFTVIQAAPTIAAIPDQTTPVNVPVTIPIIVTDADTPLSGLTLSFSTTNPSLVRDVTFITAGTNVSATINVISNKTGTAGITITVSDATSSAASTFRLNVTPGPCQPPVIAAIAPQTAAGSSITVSIPVSDPNDPLTDLTFAASTVGNSIVSGASFNQTASAVTATFTLFPGATGTETVTVQASDGCGSGKQTFTLTAGGGNPPATITAGQSGTNFVLTVSGTPGASYVIESTTNFKSWTVFDTITIPAGGSAAVTAPVLPGTRTFFRVRAGTGALAAQKTALLVVGNATLVAGDLAVSNRLASLGYSITVKDGPTSVASDANGKTLVVLSSTITSADGVKFAGTTVPVVTWEQAVTDNFLFNLDAATDHNTTTADQTQINILATTHPLAAGLTAGLHTVASSPTTFSWGNPQGKATKIATIAGNTNQVAIFGYDAGATMLGTNLAPARRVFLFLQDPGISVTTAEGTALFDAAINWAASSDVTKPGDAIQTVSGTNDAGDTASGPPPAAETVDHVIDNLAAKYLNFLDLGSGFIVTPSMGRTLVNGIRVWAANDAPERDPASYTVEGSVNGPNGPWTVISTGALALPTGRNAAGALNVNTSVYQDVYFSNSAPYTSYRVTFPTLRNVATANSMQVGEVDLFGFAD
jgi:subtilisin-like proprotein convertase family protein